MNAKTLRAVPCILVLRVSVTALRTLQVANDRGLPCRGGGGVMARLREPYVNLRCDLEGPVAERFLALKQKLGRG